MLYTLILTETAEGGIQVTIPTLPACRVEAATRDEAIRLAREAIAQLVRRSEVVQVDIPEQPRTTGVPHETPWAWFGTAREDPTWDALFDEIEQHRRRRRYADLMIAAMVIAGQHILVTRNRTDFVDVLPTTQLANWIDDPPDAS